LGGLVLIAVLSLITLGAFLVLNLVFERKKKDLLDRM